MATTEATAGAPGKGPPAADAHVAYWEKHCAPVLGSLLGSASSYSVAEQEAQLRLLADQVLPHLGPRPSEAHTTSHLTKSCSPFQPSINFNGDKPRARYCWEPLGPRGGSADDPFAIEAGRRILASLFGSFGFYPGWKDAWLDAFALTPDEVRDVRAKLPAWVASQFPPGAVVPPIDRISFTFVAFELKGAHAAVKAYFNPKTKEIATGKSPDDTVWSVIRSLEPSLNPKSVDMVAE